MPAPCPPFSAADDAAARRGLRESLAFIARTEAQVGAPPVHSSVLRALADAPAEARVDGILQVGAGVPTRENLDRAPEGSLIVRVEARSRAFRDALRVDSVVADALAPLGWRVLEKRTQGNTLAFIVFNPQFSPAFPA